MGGANPGYSASPTSTAYVIPDVFVRKHQDRWVEELNPDIAPRLRINADYASYIKRADNSADNNFLRDNLHHLVVGDVSFPANPREAIRRGFRNAEQLFLNMAQKNGVVVDKSGSCATCALVIGIFLGLNLQMICAMLPMSETAEHFSQLVEAI